MQINTNSIFSEVFSDDINTFLNQHHKLPEALEKIINNGFREEQNCILLRESEYFSPELKDDFDKCSFEDFMNHIHIDQYVSESSDELEYLRIGLELGRQLYVKLKELFPRKFRVTISYSNTTYDGAEIEVYGGCVVRFYSVRESCDNKFFIENLDAYESEAVITFEG